MITLWWLFSELRCALGLHPRVRGERWTWCRDCFKEIA